MEQVTRFVNDAVLGWDLLSKDLAIPKYVDPDVSRVALAAGTLLSVLRHAPELFEWRGSSKSRVAMALELCPGFRVIMDAADTWKHHKLSDPLRETKFSTQSVFLVEPSKGYRFIRNKIVLGHPTLGDFDVLILARAAIRFWLQHQKIELPWQGTLFEGAEIYRERALLTWVDGEQPFGQSICLVTCSRDLNGSLVPNDFAEVQFALVNDKGLLEPQPVASTE